MRCKIEVARARRVMIWEDVCPAVLQPQFTPLLLEACEVRVRARDLPEVDEALAHRVSWHCGENLLERAPVEARPIPTPRLDDRGSVACKLVVVPVPQESVPSRGLS